MRNLIVNLSCLVSLATHAAWASDPTIQERSEFWLVQAESACDQIQDARAADLVLSRLHSIYLEWGSVDRAQALTERIQDPAPRVRAHIANAKSQATSGEKDLCLAELKQAQPLANDPALRHELVDAYLDYAESPQLAISFIQDDPGVAIVYLCEALAKRGHLSEALEVAESEKDPQQSAVLKLKIALAVAQAARIADTERAIEHVRMERANEYYKQSVWMALAEALHKDQDYDAARKYAARVTEDGIKRRNGRILQWIAKGQQPTQLSPEPPLGATGMSPGNSPDLAQAIEARNPDQANQIVTGQLTAAMANPVAPSSGQFGPVNQEIRLAMIRIEYAKVGLLYHIAGHHAEAMKKLTIAAEALPILLQENAFIAMLSLITLHQIQVAMNDIEGLKRTTAAVPSGLWFRMADQIVEKVLTAGDVDAAKAIALRVLSEESTFGTKPADAGATLISRFVMAGETQKALELVKSSILDDFGAAACENAGRALVESGRSALLASRAWTKALRPEQRALVCIGAATKARESS